MVPMNWEERISTESSNKLLKGLALWHARQAKDCEQSRLIIRMLNRGDWLGLCQLELDYAPLNSLEAYHLRQALALFSKRDDLDLGIDRKAVAHAKFLEAEQVCRETNEIFRARARGGFAFHPRVEAVLHTASRKIAQCLGEVPSLGAIRPRFGPGATTTINKKWASPRSKLAGGLFCSEDFLPMLGSMVEDLPLWVDTIVEAAGGWSLSDITANSNEIEVDYTAQLEFGVCPGKLDFVPKNAKTDRAIVVEPVLNGFYQLGIGDHMVRRLAASGLDLKVQEGINKRLARFGSLTGALATLDLSSASDTIARELVYDLLPLDWFLLLDHLRTGVIEYEDQEIRLEKFSSMGNGFTFPLETLIFWSLARATCEVIGIEGEIGTYGDDIIVPVEAYPLLSTVLRAVGFIPNQSKSFNSGSFRESCGGDYLSGKPIRPCYVKHALNGSDVFVLHNYYVRNGWDRPTEIVASWIPDELKLYGPDGYGDGHLLGEWHPVPLKRDRGWGGFTFETFSRRGRKSFRKHATDYVFPVYSIYVSPPSTMDLPFPRDGRFWYGRGSGFCNTSWRHRTLMRTYIETGGGFIHHPDTGALGVTLPGSEGYKRIRIYTFVTP